MTQRIVILAGIHGNEPGPSLCLQRLVHQPSFWKGLANKVTVFPAINKYGLAHNQRHDGNDLDLNRSWNLTKGPALKKLNIIKSKIIGLKGSGFSIPTSLVLDFHEAWGFHRCSNVSLGQSIFVPPFPCSLNGVPIKTLAKRAVALLNQTVTEPCDKWDVKTELPKVTGDCRSFCNGKRIPHVLVEMAGQNNVRSLKKREENTRIILGVFLMRETS